MRLFLTQKTIFLDKNRHGYGSILGSIRVYTANSGTNTKYTEYTGIWAFAELQAGSLQYNCQVGGIERSVTLTKTNAWEVLRGGVWTKNREHDMPLPHVRLVQEVDHATA